MEMVTAGLLNKNIAGNLNLSEITVKFHRRSVMEKMQAESLADLVKMSERVRGVHRSNDTIEKTVPEELDVHLVMDNYATHKTAAIRRWLLKRSRFHVHFTPTSASWLNLVERWFVALTDKQLRRDSFRSTRELEITIRDYLQQHNAQPKPFVWTKSADQILDSIARYCRRINDSPH
jgi:hypothetical protein